MESSKTDLYRDRRFVDSGLASLTNAMEDEEKSVLEVGPGSGSNTLAMRERGRSVTVVTISALEAEKSRGIADRVILADVEDWARRPPGETFDAILLSHVLEHLVDPWSTLRNLTAHLRPGGGVYVALPNAAFVSMRLRVIVGDLSYEPSGIRDQSHLRQFSPATARALVESSGLIVDRTWGWGHIPLGPIRRLMPSAARLADRAACAAFPGLFYFHIFIKGSSRRDAR